MSLSVGIITFCEAAKISRTLEAVRGWADQIVVVDSGSTDGTQEICRSYGALVIQQDWLGYGPQKNVVIDHCTQDWILALDADEVVTPALRTAIDQKLANPQTAMYAIRFENFLLGQTIRHGGWEGEYVKRLFRRGSGRWNDDPVHETFVTPHPIGYINTPIEHHSYLKLEEMLDKHNRYTTLEAYAAYRSDKPPRPGYAIWFSTYVFWLSYLRKLGFLDGIVGLQLALYRGLYYFDSDRKLADLYAGRMKLPG